MSMIMSVTDAIVSKGYDDQPAVRFSENGDFVRFRFGNSKYDKNAQNNKRWINMSAKAFDAICQRIQKMQIKEGSHVNLIGEYDEETWVDSNTGEKKTAPSLTLIHIEYASSGNGNKQPNAGGAAAQPPPGGGQQAQPAQTDTGQAPPQQAAQPQRGAAAAADPPRGNDARQMPESFEGYQNFEAGGNPYFPERV